MGQRAIQEFLKVQHRDTNMNFYIHQPTKNPLLKAGSLYPEQKRVNDALYVEIIAIKAPTV